MKVLIVDDDRVSRMLLGHILTKEFGATCTEALHGGYAMDLLKQGQTFDFILLDLMMPVMDGLQTLEAIRAEESMRGLPVIILSAVKEEWKVRRILELGVADYLAKPLHPKSILERLQRLVPILEAAKGSQTGAAEAEPVEDPNSPMVEIVVADGDPTFRSFVRGLLGREYRIIDAETGAKALRRCLEARPAMLLLGDSLGAVDRGLVVRKLRLMPEGRSTRVISLLPTPRSEPTKIDTLCNATMVRTFVAKQFLEQFGRVAAAIEKAAPGEGELVAGVQLELVTTVEQVFGMMLGVEVEQLDTHPPMSGLWISAAVDLTMLHEDFSLGVVCSCPADAGGKIATMKPSPSSDWIGNDHAAAALGDIATIIAERLQRRLAESGRRVQGSVAAVRRGPAPTSDMALLRLSFNSADGTLPFHVAVRGDKAVTSGALTQSARSI
jgi:CheY-like chemotaxis protein